MADLLNLVKYIVASTPETSTLLSELDVEVEIISPRTCLPWGAVKDKIDFPESVVLNPSVKPGEFVLQTQFAEFTVLANKKINQVLEPQVRLILGYIFSFRVG